MSLHRREYILENIQTVLTNVSSIKSSQRWKQNGNPLATVPCTIVKSAPETKVQTPHPQATCNFAVYVDLWTTQDESDTSDTDTILNALLLDVEKALMADVTRGGYAENTKITAITPFETIEGAPMCGLIIELEIIYQHKLTDPSVYI